MDFSSFAFDAKIASNIKAAGYTEATPIQSGAIGPVLEGRDVLGLAQTGTGKTAAFLLPIFQRLLGGERCVPRALILSPTRELAMQTYKAAQLLGKGTGIRSISLYGGTSTFGQIKALKKDMPELIIACPGRLVDLYERKAISLSKIDMLVLDEADEMLDLGFLPSIRKILEALPKKHQTLLFSATLPEAIQSLVKQFQQNPVRVEIGHSKPVDTVSHFICHVGQENKYETLKTILKDEVDGQTLVFTKTKHRARKLAKELEAAGHPAASLQGNLSQGQRDKAMESFRSGKVNIMVATDIASRGIDISKITHVINFDMPDTPEAYTHRVGRTGRMMRKGVALSFVTSDDRRMLRTIEKVLGRQIELHPASQEPAPSTERYTNPRSQGRRPARQSYADQYGNTGRREARNGDRPYGDRPYGNRPAGANPNKKKANDRSYSGKAYSDNRQDRRREEHKSA